MRQKIFWLDLTVCSLWVLLLVGSRSWFSFPVSFLTLGMVLARIVFSFTFYNREKRCWLPLACFTITTVMSMSVGQDIVVNDIIALPFRVLGISIDPLPRKAIVVGLFFWLWIAPIIVYAIAFFRKALSKDTLSKKEALGAFLWRDNAARTYCQLMLITIGALYMGLPMDKRMCWFGCLVMPSLAYYLIAKYYDKKQIGCDGQKNFSVGKVCLTVVAMAAFFYAQSLAGMWRVWVLAASLAMVTYVCWQTFGRKGMLILYASSVLYIGVLLPTLTIGHNQYACIEYGRRGFGTLESYCGIFFVWDSKSERLGLRDRYGLLVKPEYEDIIYNTPRHFWGTLELRRNGYYTLYDICDNRLKNDDNIDHQLQDSICMLLDKHMISNGYEYNEKIEVKVKDANNFNRLISHVKVHRNGSTSYYDYEDKPYIVADSVIVSSGECATDSIEYHRDGLYIFNYSNDVKRDSTVLYNIELKTARSTIPQHDALAELAKEIELLLR